MRVLKFLVVSLVALFTAMALYSQEASPPNVSTEATVNKPAFIEMVNVPSKTFPLFEKNENDRPPQMFQTVDSFLIGKYEVTQSQFETIMGYNGSKFVGPNRPKDQASWYEAIVFCNMLSMREGLDPVYKLNGSVDPKAWGTLPGDDGKGGWNTRSGDYHKWDKVQCNWKLNGFRLPSEMEWRSAAMGGYAGPTFGTNGLLYKFAGDPSPGVNNDLANEYGWVKANSMDVGQNSHDVGLKKPNEYGIYDLAGNVWEWVWDWASGKGYYLGDEKNYHGPNVGNGQKIRVGGSWTYEPYFAANGGHAPYCQELNAGFRVARSK